MKLQQAFHDLQESGSLLPSAGSRVRGAGHDKLDAEPLFRCAAVQDLHEVEEGERLDVQDVQEPRKRLELRALPSVLILRELALSHPCLGGKPARAQARLRPQDDQRQAELAEKAGGVDAHQTSVKTKRLSLPLSKTSSSRVSPSGRFMSSSSFIHDTNHRPSWKKTRSSHSSGV